MSHRRLTYFDNSATSFPKPPEVISAMTEYLTDIGGSYGRSANGRGFTVAKTIERCRDALASVLGVQAPEKVCFTANATQAANTLINGLSLQGGTVYLSPMEHNALARPLEALRVAGHIKLEQLPALPDGTIDSDNINLSADTRLVVINHQSNVNGVTQPLARIRQAVSGVPLLVDASQSLGKTPFLAEQWGLDYVIFTGHKGLMGPTGTGGFWARNPATITPLLLGGTGSNSEHLSMPISMPDRFEAGTHNIVGLFGLEAALANKPLSSYGEQHLHELLAGIADLPAFKLYAADNPDQQGSLFSLTHQTMDASELTWRLSDEFAIDTRAGLHCAPLAHQHLGTFPTGTSRISLSPYHSVDDLAYLLEALQKLAYVNRA